MKSILISIQPKWCELIASGKKTVEIRKTKPKLETPFKCYIYCTKDEPLYHSGEKFVCGQEFGNGKVVGEFLCDKITDCRDINGQAFFTISCMSLKEWMKYTEGHKGIVWAWHISNLVIYDKPRKLGEFRKPCKETNLCYPDNCNRCAWNTVTRPPQNWCYVESEVKTNDYQKNN